MLLLFFFFKQKTAYEMRISDWSSDVCSSDLFKKLMVLARGQGLSTHAPTAQLRRIVLGLRVIDALGEGASLRTIGEAFVRADDWPGEGESTKSTARRLGGLRSEERRVGKECGGACRSRWCAEH